MPVNRMRNLARAAACVAAAAIAASACTGSAQPSAGTKSDVGLPSPSLVSTPSATWTATQIPTPTLEPTLTPRPTPLAAGKPWGGIVWSEAVKVTSPWPGGVNQVVQWKGHFIGIGDGDAKHRKVVVASSADLVHWEILAQGATSPANGDKTQWLVADGSRLVVYGLNGDEYGCQPTDLFSVLTFRACRVSDAWASTDGRAWQKISLAGLGQTDIATVVRGRSGWVAVGNAGAGKPVVFTSSDGSRWQGNPLPGVGSGQSHVNAVQAIKGGYLAFGFVRGPDPTPPPGWGDDNWITLPNTVAAAWWSSDGRAWQVARIGAPTDRRTLNVAYEASHGIFAKGDYFQNIDTDPSADGWTSTNGRSWQHVDTETWFESTTWPYLDYSWFVSDGTTIYAYEDDEQDVDGEWDQLWASSDGKTWHRLKIFNETRVPRLSPAAIFLVPGGVDLLTESFQTGSDGQLLVAHGAAVP